ncbi:helix-turn-helix transcriptional regulator [Oceanobacillus jeddahense]|uniref:AraC family transcriptional regulator n=1 Tax=Oceanobacillus jeddahense TaxID=1462527 RepID=A0ABY5JR67_9BACI|nr:AraC family transcriptional regulator [Oceanobacillus jeddahense]UUI02790.1 AraC family transcriptional regulator [Oceanobacillus jeddahense]
MNKMLTTNQGLFLFKTEFEQESLKRSDNCYKLIYSLGGKTTYQLSRQDITFHADQMLLLNPYDAHRQLEVAHHKFLIELDPQMVNNAAKTLMDHSANIQFAQMPQQTPQITKWVAFILDYLQGREEDLDKSMEVFLDNSFIQLAILLMKGSVNNQYHDINEEVYRSVNFPIRQVMEAMKESYNSNWTLDDMAAIAQLDKYRFSHVFKEKVGVSPFSWLQIYRIQRSLDKLQFTNATILQIAMESGFSSVSMYNRLFKKLYGMTPSYFRNSRNT